MDTTQFKTNVRGLRDQFVRIFDDSPHVVITPDDREAIIGKIGILETLYDDLVNKYLDRGEQMIHLLEFIEEKNLGDPFARK